MAHERLTESRAQLEWLLSKPRSFSTLPAFLDLNGISRIWNFSGQAYFNLGIPIPEIWDLSVVGIFREHLLIVVQKTGMMPNIFKFSNCGFLTESAIFCVRITLVCQATRRIFQKLQSAIIKTGRKCQFEIKK